MIFRGFFLVGLIIMLVACDGGEENVSSSENRTRHPNGTVVEKIDVRPPANFWISVDGSGRIYMEIVDGQRFWYLPDDDFVRRLQLDLAAGRMGYVFQSNDVYAQNSGSSTVSYDERWFHSNGSTNGSSGDIGAESTLSCVDVIGGTTAVFQNNCSVAVNLTWWTETGFCNDGCAELNLSPGGTKRPAEQITGRVRWNACRYPLVKRANNESNQLLTFQLIESNDIGFSCI